VILVDTSVWIDHFRSRSGLLVKLLDQQRVLLHPFVLGEIACGNLKQRQEIISLLHALPTLQSAGHDDILYFIDHHNLMGRGVGLIDVHLLASCLMQRCLLWTADKRLKAVSQELDTAFDPTIAEHAR
jgi:predicted nucleic acid-binding protein